MERMEKTIRINGPFERMHREKTRKGMLNGLRVGSQSGCASPWISTQLANIQELMPHKEEDAMKKPSNKKSDPSKSSLTEATASDSALRERITRKAYELYEKRGWDHGLDTEDWLEAERLVLSETKTGTKTDAITKAKKPGSERNIATKSGSVLDRPRST